MPIAAVNTSGSTVFDKAREGMSKGQRKLDKAAAKIAGGDVSVTPMVDMIVAETMYTANATVIRTQDEMLGSLLDVKR